MPKCFQLSTTLFAVIAGAACSSAAIANDTVPTINTDTNGTTAIQRLENARIAYESAKFELEAAQAQVSAMTTGAIETSTAADSTRRAQPEAEPEVPADPTSWTKGWDWTADAGFSGSSGNTENFSARVALGGQRNTTKYETSMSLSYLYGTSDGEKNTARAEIKFNNDWLTDSKWRYFAQGGYEYDEFQAWQHRFNAAGGVGYEFINDDKTTLIGRVGLGASYTTGSAADEVLVPEGLLGLEWSYKLSTNTSLKASTTYYPSFDDIGEFRWNSGAGIEIILDAETGMTMNAGVDHRHDSDAGSSIKPNDVNYYMGVGWKF